MKYIDAGLHISKWVIIKPLTNKDQNKYLLFAGEWV